MVEAIIYSKMREWASYFTQSINDK